MSTTNLFRTIFFVSILWMLGSMYVSYFGDPRQNIRAWDMRNTALGISPCTLCRYTRICLFPIVPISFIAWRHHDTKIRKTILPLAIIGLIISTYIWGIEMHRRAKSNALCGINSVVPCWDPKLLYWGWFTLATAGIWSFCLIIRACRQLRTKKHAH